MVRRQSDESLQGFRSVFVSYTRLRSHERTRPLLSVGSLCVDSFCCVITHLVSGGGIDHHGVGGSLRGRRRILEETTGDD